MNEPLFYQDILSPCKISEQVASDYFILEINTEYNMWVQKKYM